MLRTNLIPPEQKERLRWKNYYQNIISSGFILFLLILVFIISLAGILLFIHFKYLSIENKITIEQSRIIQTESYKDLEKKIINLNKNLADFRKTQNQKSNIYSLLDNISSSLFVGVTVYSLDVNRTAKLITVSGFSPTRENLLAIKNNLETNPNYKDIDFPLSNLANPQNINFRFSFIYER